MDSRSEVTVTAGEVDLWRWVGWWVVVDLANKGVGERGVGEGGDDNVGKLGDLGFSGETSGFQACTGSGHDEE